MIDQRLVKVLEGVARRYRKLSGWRGLTVAWLATALAGAVLLAVGWQTGWSSPWAMPALAVAAFASSVLVLWRATQWTRDLAAIARRIEAKHPDLDSLLMAAIEQQPARPGIRLGFLQDTVIREALAHNRRIAWENDVPARWLHGTRLAGNASLALVLLVLSGLASQASRLPSGARGTIPGPDLAAPRYEVTVTPGDTGVERGTSLVVTARFADRLPDDATLVCRTASGETSRLPMSLSLSDPMFGARVPGVQTDLTYQIEFADRATRSYRVQVYEHPELRRADVRLVFPEYTSLEEKRVEDTRRVTAVEGTQWTLTCQLNKPVQTARLVSQDGATIDLAAGPQEPAVVSATRVLQVSGRYKLELVDADGRTNKEPPEFVFTMTPNRPPDIKLTAPARDLRVSPLEELNTKLSVWDDYGLLAYGIHYTLPGQPPRDITLGERTARNERRDVEHLINFEALAAEPDQLLAYHIWAEDIGPDGQPRKTLGDMYFAEVRHFEEIFRQGEQPPGGSSSQQQPEQQQGGQNARQAEQLAELQKEIVNATWKVIRREAGSAPTAEFGGDVQELQKAQTQALEQLQELTEKLEDPQSLQHAAAVQQHMTEALNQLTEANQSSSPSTLTSALAAEQAAYQALLKLRAREFSVTRGRPQSSQANQSGRASGPQSRAQQQLDQLELKDSENRYETQRQPLSQQEQAQRETLQVLNRLRELARRQADLNQRMKELQSALEEAQSEAEREQIRDQLKRLREQEQQVLRDTDELAERMERPENQERMGQSRQDLEQTRENIRQTTDALQQGQVSQAVASGTRAERQLDQMREEFRNAASSGFSDQVRELRNAARQLHENETRLGAQLQQLGQAKPKPKSNALRDRVEGEPLGEQFQRQRRDLEQLLDNIRETVEQAEEAEPLMSARLYDSARDARQQRVDDALQATEQLLERGFPDQAAHAEAQAGRGIEQLKQGVEAAAESVLGDDDEALRRAHETLQELADQVNEEIRQAPGAPQEPGDRPDGGQPKQGPQGAGKPGAKQAQDGKAPAGRTGEKPSPKGQGGTGTPREGAAGQPSAPREQRSPNGQAGEPPAGQPDEQRPADAPGSRAGPQPEPNVARTEAGGSGPGGVDRIRRPGGPITGDFQRWSDQMRDVEELLDDAALRSQAARIREAARDLRRDTKRDYRGPNWDLVREFIAQPLNELRDRVAEDRRRRQSDAALVPIDRDPVPPRYEDQVHRYYEQLGSGK